MEIKEKKKDTLRAKQCVICGNSDLKHVKGYFVPFLIERMFDNENIKSDVLFCDKCNFYFSEVRPNDEQMIKLYTNYRDDFYQKQRENYEDYYTKEFNDFLGTSEKTISDRKKFLSNLLEGIIDFSQIENVLDYGGDKGQFIPDEFKNANKYVYDISGIDTVKGVNKIKSFEELLSRRWDFIMCCHVLEHLSYPMDVLNNIISIMPKGAYLYIELPYESYVENTDKKALHIHEHINFFRPKTLHKVFESDDYMIIINKLTQNRGLISCLIYKLKDNECMPLFNRIFKKQNNEMLEMENLIASNFDYLNNNIKQIERIVFNQDELYKINFLQRIFSLRNEGRHKVIRFLGMKVKVKRKKNANKK